MNDPENKNQCNVIYKSVDNMERQAIFIGILSGWDIAMSLWDPIT